MRIIESQCHNEFFKKAANYFKGILVDLVAGCPLPFPRPARVTGSRHAHEVFGRLATRKPSTESKVNASFGAEITVD